MLDGAFNDVHNWNFARIPEVLGTGLGIKVKTETEMAAALPVWMMRSQNP